MKQIITIILSISLSQFCFAEGKSNGGDEFRKTATEYQSKADKYGEKGKYKIAALYQRMSEIKLDAASKADQGKWDDIDWSEYHKIEGQIAELKQSKKKYKK